MNAKQIQEAERAGLPLPLDGSAEDLAGLQDRLTSVLHAIEVAALREAGAGDPAMANPTLGVEAVARAVRSSVAHWSAERIAEDGEEVGGTEEAESAVLDYVADCVRIPCFRHERFTR